MDGSTDQNIGVKTKAGFVIVFGKPNAGKSTLMNALLNFNLSIVNRKVQTTRNRISGILTEDNFQIVFIDTPGVLSPKYELHKFMLSEIASSFDEADILLMIVDAAVRNPFEDVKYVYEAYEKNFGDKKKILALNKADIAGRDVLMPLSARLFEAFGFDEIVPVSALKKENIDRLKEVIVKFLPEGHFFYDEETLTDKPEKFFAAEILREKILSLYHDEIPYSVMVSIQEFAERSDKLVYINAEIIVERESQKAVIIGKGGESLKKTGAYARKSLEHFLGKKVFLELFVKVRKGWRNNKNFVKDSMIRNSPS